jgi:hypothetical protein
MIGQGLAESRSGLLVEGTGETLVSQAERLDRDDDHDRHERERRGE